MKIFVADDSARLREQLFGMLSELNGVEIIGQAQEVIEASRAISKLKPDVVTLDIQLLGGSGIEVLKTVKQTVHAPVVIMLTNCTSLPYRKRCAEAGADFFLDKSTELEKVREIIKNLLGRFESTVAETP